MLIMTHGNQMSKTSVFASLDTALPQKPDLEDFWIIETLGITKSVEPDRADETAMETVKQLNLKMGDTV